VVRTWRVRVVAGALELGGLGTGSGDEGERPEEVMERRLKGQGPDMVASSVSERGPLLMWGRWISRWPP
jgi:hypothetical protein